MCNIIEIGRLGKINIVWMSDFISNNSSIIAAIRFAVRFAHEVRVRGNSFDYEFTSSGPNGLIKKVVEFRRLSMPTNVQIFNLAFGDVNPKTQKMDDLVVTDNKDTVKVLATVAHIVTDFTEQYPDAIIFAKGSTEARNRLYQMAIVKYWSEIKELFDVYGELRNGLFIKFISGINFTAFYAMRKKQ